MGDEIGCVFMCVFEAGGGLRVWERTRLTLIPLMSRRPCPPAWYRLLSTQRMQPYEQVPYLISFPLTSTPPPSSPTLFFVLFELLFIRSFKAAPSPLWFSSVLPAPHPPTPPSVSTPAIDGGGRPSRWRRWRWRFSCFSGLLWLMLIRYAVSVIPPQHICQRLENKPKK